MAKRLLLFDLDWTLIYTGGAGVRALNAAFEGLYQIPKAITGITLDGKTDPAICREMVKFHFKREPEAAELDVLCRRYIENLAQEVPEGPGYRILPGIPELLEVLSKNPDVVMGLGTGNLEAGARIKLARADFMKYFRFGGFADDSEIRPELLRKGVERGETLAGRKFAPRDVVVIGDNLRDVQAGKAIGAVTVAVASGPMTMEELAQTQPDHLFQDLSRTADVLRVLLS